MKKLILTASAVIPAIIAAYDNKTGWKMDGETLVLKDGNPVYVDSAGVEKTVNSTAISTLNSEAQGFRVERDKAVKERDKALADLKVFDGLNVTKAKAALETVSKLDAKQLIDAGEVEKVRGEISKNFQTKIDDLEKANVDLRGTVNAMRSDNAFANSKFIADKIGIPKSAVRAEFGSHFKHEDGKLVGYDHNGEKIYSPERSGELASFDEAMEVLITKHPEGAAAYLKASGGSGSGGSGDGGQGGGAGATMSRAAFDNLSPNEQAAAGKKAGAGELTIT